MAPNRYGTQQIWHLTDMAPNIYGTQQISQTTDIAPNRYGTQQIWYPTDMAPNRYGTQLIWHPTVISHNRFADICSDISGFAERVHQMYCKLLQRNYELKLLEKTFNRFLCHHSDTLLKYGPNIQDLLYVCLNLKTSNEHSVVDHCTTGNVTYRST